MCYRAAHIARKCQLLAASTTLFGTANTVTPTGDTITPETFVCLDSYLDNLASAATTKRTTLIQLVETNASLTAMVAALTASVTALTATYTLLANGRNSATPQPMTGTQATFPRMGLNPTGYCWMHGYRVKVGHNSATCTNKAEGHQLAATCANIMGGSTKNKPTTT